MRCPTNYADFEVPPGIAPSGHYVVVIDGEGAHKILDKPASSAFLYFSGSTFEWADGSASSPFKLPNLISVGVEAQLAGVISVGTDGSIAKLANHSGTEKVLMSKDGKTYFGDGVTSVIIPPTGSGWLSKSNAGTVEWLSDLGVLVNTQDDGPKMVPFGVPGSVFRMQGTEAVFADPAVGAVLGGTDTNDIAAVRARSTSNTEIKVDIAAINTTDGGSLAEDIISYVAVDLTYDITDTVDGELDTGSEASNTWYYLYLIGGASVPARLIASLDPVMPTAFPTDYTHWALVSVFRNGSDGHIVPFVQNGRRFTTGPVVVGTNMTVTTSMADMGADLSGIIPSTAKAITGILSSSSYTPLPVIGIAANAAGLGLQFLYGTDTNIAHILNFYHSKANFYDLPILNPADQTFFWQAASHTTQAKVAITGYTV